LPDWFDFGGRTPRRIVAVRALSFGDTFDGLGEIAASAGQLPSNHGTTADGLSYRPSCSSFGPAD